MGVGIERFSIGFGKAIFSFKYKEEHWQIGWLPLGGFVSLKGQDPSQVDNDERSFLNKAWWKRALIVFAGPFANLILGTLLFIVSFAVPIRTSDHHPVIFEAKGAFSEVFAPGDSIISVNNAPVEGFIQALGLLSSKKSNTLVVQRDSLQRTLQISGNEVDSLYMSISPMVGTRIGEVFAGMPAWRAGIHTGDIITHVDSVKVEDWYKMRDLITNAPGSKVRLSLLRDGKKLLRDVVLEQNDALSSERLIGITNYQPVEKLRKFGLGEAIVLGSSSALDFVVRNYSALFKLFAKPKQLARNVGGPVMIATMSSQAGDRGLAYLMMFFASISLILMTMNLLPIPVLDGGHIFFYIIEGIFGKPVPLKIQAILQRMGLMILVILMVMAFYSDLSKVMMRALAK